MKEIKLVSDTINRDDINALIEWLNQDPIPRLTKGDLTIELEKKWAEKIGTKYSVFVNSGSSSLSKKDQDEVAQALSKMNLPNLTFGSNFELQFFIRMLFSCDVSADHLDTEGFQSPSVRQLRLNRMHTYDSMIDLYNKYIISIKN